PDAVLLVLAQELGGLIGARPDLGEARSRAELLRALEALADLGAALEGVPACPVEHPPVPVGLTDHARPPIAEAPVHAIRPEVGRLDDVGVRRAQLPVEQGCSPYGSVL